MLYSVFILFVIFSALERNVLGSADYRIQIGILWIFGTLVSHDTCDAVIYISVNA